MNLRKGILYTLLSTAILFTLSCSKDDDDNPQPKQTVQTVMIKDLAADPVGHDPNTGAPTGGTNQYTFFCFSDSTIVANSDSATTKWDIGFRGTDIIINGGISGPGNVEGQVLKSTLEDVTAAPSENYITDSTSGHVFADWYNYNTQTHIVTAKPGYIFIIHTNDDKYVKMELISYYKGAPAQPELTDASRYYTFRYVYQPDGSREFSN